jgi:hypothetical protein
MSNLLYSPYHSSNDFSRFAPVFCRGGSFKKNSERGIAFMGGGMSQTEREILKDRGKGYSLKLIFSSKRGEFLSNVIVKVFDQKNQTMLITVSSGPWLFIDLPNGTYKIEVSFRGD